MLLIRLVFGRSAGKPTSFFKSAMKTIYKILILIAAAFLLWICGYAVGRSHLPEATTTTQIDTIVRYDTIRMEKPGEIVSYKSSVPVLLPMTDTVRLRDTVYVVFEREIKEYKDASYFARISGYDPSLDYIEVYPKTTTISKTETVIQKPSAWHYSVYLELDYGFLLKTYLTPSIGAEFGFKRVTIGAECGASIGLVDRVPQTPKPYLQATVKYRLAGR